MSKTVKAKLRALDLRNTKVHTRWGHVQFDKDGLAELDVPEEELQMLRDIRPFSWLAEDHVPVKQASEPLPRATWPTIDPVAADHPAFDVSDEGSQR